MHSTPSFANDAFLDTLYISKKKYQICLKLG